VEEECKREKEKGGGRGEGGGEGGVGVQLLWDKNFELIHV